MYGAVLADLENDYMKGDTNYPMDMPAAYRFLDEFKLDKLGKESHERSSTHIAFVQGNSEVICYGCGLPGYTKSNCSKCSQSKKSFSPRNKQNVRPKPRPHGK